MSIFEYQKQYLMIDSPNIHTCFKPLHFINELYGKETLTQFKLVIYFGI